MKKEFKLKTLKDLNFKLVGTDEKIKEKLKAEAVKWVKEDRFKVENGDYNIYDVMDWWMKRLDIKEEELK